MDLTGKRFGRVRVLGYGGWLGHEYAWVCLCDCGSSVMHTRARLTARSADKLPISCGCRTGKRRSKCVVACCSTPPLSATSNGSGRYCGMHRQRIAKHGSAAFRPRKYFHFNKGYKMVHAPGHPLSQSSGYAAEHRLKMWNKHGRRRQNCHWCGVRVKWLPVKDDGSLVIDHLNEDKGDNRLKNLVFACWKCNADRGLYLEYRRQFEGY